MKFRSFIKKMSKSRKYKNTPKMDFVEDVLRDLKLGKTNPKYGRIKDYKSWEELENYLLTMSACSEAKQAAREVWNDFDEAYPQPVDGLSRKNIEQIRSALREVWSWSYPHRLCKARATGKDGFPVCEQCKKKVPKVFVDHIQNVGNVDEGFIKRLFVPSKFLQALCKECHDDKTYLENLDFR